MRDRLGALEEVVGHISELDRLRTARLCVLAPAREPGFRRVLFVAGGRVASARTVPAGAAGALELRTGLEEARLAEASLVRPSYAPADADDLLAVAGFIRRPGPELRVIRLDSTDQVAQSHQVSRILAA